MATKKTNPFILPGFGQSGDMAQNPLLASMEMMRNAWEGLTKTSGLDQALAAGNLSPEEVERRIRDLRVVEQWLRMNLSMLASTIQALEVQRSTMATLNSFLTAATGAGTAMPSASMPTSTGEAPVSGDSSGLFGQPRYQGSEQADAAAPGAANLEQATATMQGWWDMLQAQFDHLSDATAATIKGAESMRDAAVAAQEQAMQTMADQMGSLQEAAQSSVAPAKKATKKAAKKASATKKTAKRATKKASAKKATAKKATAKKAAKRAAKKAAVKSTPPKS